MPGRMGTGNSAAAPSAPAAPSAGGAQPAAGSFSSAPVAPVVTNSHGRRREQDASWLQKSAAGAKPAAGDTTAKAKTAAKAAAVAVAARRERQRERERERERKREAFEDAQSDGSGTADEDIRSAAHSAKPAAPEPSAGQSQQGVALDEDENMSEDDMPLSRSRPQRGRPAKSAAVSQNGENAADKTSSGATALSGTAALLQLRERRRNSSNDKSSSASGSGSASGGSYTTPSTNPAGSNSSSTTSSGDQQPSGSQLQSQGQSQGGNSNGNINPGSMSANSKNSGRRSRSRSGERGASSSSQLQQEEGMDEDDDDDVDDEGDSTSPPSPGGGDRDVRVVFHGRQVFAEDLIGLRVAKTFVGHGRFLGQVVKFDESTSMYTVVYADGDAEDLSIDSTLQILIQDEIERADPSQPPPAMSLLFKKDSLGPSTSPASPDTQDFMAQPPQEPRRGLTASRAPQTDSDSGNRPIKSQSIQVSDREAQFVVGLFENHALPILMHRGWRVQSSASGDQKRFVSPTGEIFVSTLDVVGYIASHNELLTTCFPSNVHSAILSLLPEPMAPMRSSIAREEVDGRILDTGSNHGSAHGSAHGSSSGRKRTTADSPSMDAFDGKRPRQIRDGGYRVAGGAMRGVTTSSIGATRSGDPAGTMGSSVYRAEELEMRAREQEAQAAARVSPAAHRDAGMPNRVYRAEELEMRAREQEAADRITSMPPERHSVGVAPSNGARVSASYDPTGYRRVSGRHAQGQSIYSSRWPGAQRVGEMPPEAVDYRRRYPEPSGWRERGDAFTSEAHPRTHVRTEPRYPGDRAPMRSSGRSPVEPPAAGGTSPGFRYRESVDGQQSPMTDGYSYQQYAPRGRPNEMVQPSRREMAAAEYRRMHEIAASRAASTSTRASRDGNSFAAPSSSGRGAANPAFSMMDVDRNSNPRGGAVRMEQAPRGHSPPRRSGTHQVYMMQPMPQGRRSGSYHSQRSNDGHYTPDAAGNSMPGGPGGVSGTPAPSQQD